MAASAEKLEYVVGIGENRVLKRRGRRLMGTARRLSREQGGSVVALFGETRYAASTWNKNKRRIVYKPESVYQIYRMRGESENRIKELLIGLELDRMS